NTGKGIFIINEGGYGAGNASLSYFNTDSNSVSNNVFYNTNSIPLGDVAQSMVIIDSIGYIVVNNSGKIEVINVNTFESYATITGFTSPRYMLPVNDEKAYITDMYCDSIAIIDLNSNSITGYINAGKNTEQMVMCNNYVFVTNWSYGNSIQVINPDSDQVVDSVEVVKQPNSIVADKNDNIWVLCDGGWVDEMPALIKLNSGTFNIENTFTFSDINSSPSKLCINANKDTIYFLNNGIYQMLISDGNLPTSPIVNTGSKLFYGLGVNPENSDI
ncbi:unnamed protein product, partial [marine sediment metagenome]